MLTGENGILTKASIAKEKNAQKTVEEQVKLAVLASKTNVNAQINTAELETELTKYGITEITKGESGNLPWTVKKDEYEYTIEEEGVKELVYVKGEDIAKNPKMYYGKQVMNYKASENDTNVYRIFYVNTNPDGEFGDPQYTIYLKADYYGNYTLSKSYESNTKVRQMNTEWANERGEDEINWSSNEKQIAYLCSPVTDTNSSLPWAQCYNPEDAEYVIGSPSIEMYVKSYNQAYKNERNTYTLGAIYSSLNSPGYMYTLNGEKSTISNNDYWTGVNSLNYTKYNNMYCKKTETGRGLWWLASTHANYGGCCVDGGEAQLTCYDAFSSAGISPIVCLNSDSEVQIEL